jgi:hypothetical protein
MSEFDAHLTGKTITLPYTVTIARPFMGLWRPLPDITTYELAQAVPLFTVGHLMTHSDFEALPEGVRRHFEVIA